MATEINNLNNVVSAKTNNQSTIKYISPASESRPFTTNLVFFGASNEVSYSSPKTRFDFNFKNPPVITTSVRTTQGDSLAVFPVILNLTNNTCEVKLFTTGTVTGDPTIIVSIIAMGEKP
jgi:hypothetical protein